MTAKAVDRRRFPRLADPQVEGRLNIRSEARLIDISLYGICLESAEALQPKRRFWLSVPDGRRQLRFLGVGVWNRLTATAPAPSGEVRAIFRGGIRFDKRPNPQTTSDLELSRFIAVNAFESTGSGEDKRYTLRPEIGPVEVEAHYDFRARAISASGMVLETDLLAEPCPSLDLLVRLPWVSLKVRGRLVRSEQVFDAEHGAHSRLTIEFEGLDEQERRQIEGLVAEGMHRGGPGLSADE